MSSMRSQKIPQTLVSCSEHVDMTSVWGLWKSFGTYGVKVKDLMSIYLYIYIYTYICASIFIYISVSTSISIICLDVNIYIYLSLSLSTFWYTNRCQNLHMCIKTWCENMFSRGAPSCPFLALKKRVWGTQALPTKSLFDEFGDNPKSTLIAAHVHPSWHLGHPWPCRRWQCRHLQQPWIDRWSTSTTSIIQRILGNISC